MKKREKAVRMLVVAPFVLAASLVLSFHYVEASEVHIEDWMYSEATTSDKIEEIIDKKMSYDEDKECFQCSNYEFVSGYEGDIYFYVEENGERLNRVTWRFLGNSEDLQTIEDMLNEGYPNHVVKSTLKFQNGKRIREVRYQGKRISGEDFGNIDQESVDGQKYLEYLEENEKYHVISMLISYDASEPVISTLYINVFTGDDMGYFQTMMNPSEFS